MIHHAFFWLDRGAIVLTTTADFRLATPTTAGGHNPPAWRIWRNNRQIHSLDRTAAITYSQVLRCPADERLFPFGQTDRMAEWSSKHWGLVVMLFGNWRLFNYASSDVPGQMYLFGSFVSLTAHLAYFRETKVVELYIWSACQWCHWFDVSKSSAGSQMPIWHFVCQIWHFLYWSEIWIWIWHIHIFYNFSRIFKPSNVQSRIVWHLF